MAPSAAIAKLGVKPRALATNELRWPMDMRDFLAEVAAGVSSRPVRTLLTSLGIGIGIAALVATLGIAGTAASQISSQLDMLEATYVTARAAEAVGSSQNTTRSAIPWDAQARLEALNGVSAAGTLSRIELGGMRVRSVAINDPLAQSEYNFDLVSASDGLFAAVGGVIENGRFFSPVHSNRGDRIAVIGPSVANQLNLTRVDQKPSIFIGNDLYTIIGIIKDVDREPSLLHSVVIPDGTARGRFGISTPDEVHIRTEIGAAELVASQIPIALDPNQPESIQVILPAIPRSFREAVETDVNALFVALGLVALLVGAISAGNTTLVSVLERVPEIGLRRALGATRAHIALQFLVEGTFVGTIGGVIGTSGGVLVLVLAAIANGWTPILDLWVVAGATILGAGVGLVAALYPAFRGATLEPVSALRLR